jgi:putative alpha-1,2-mannosidase
VTLNGQPLTRSFVRHEEILRGGELRFTMTDRPNTGWAIRPADRPYSMSPYR